MNDGPVQIPVVEGDVVAAAAQAPGQQAGCDTGAVPAAGAADRDVQWVFGGVGAAGVCLCLGDGGGDHGADAGGAEYGADDLVVVGGQFAQGGVPVRVAEVLAQVERDVCVGGVGSVEVSEGGDADLHRVLLARP